ncbi:MAG: alpha/beta hydrolase [Chloroflexi bacterium]|nr:alpha/beta hydrolase [Chloroflexota bacterium]
MVNFVRQGEGAPVILVHGLAASLHDWDFLIPDLTAAGHESCALDLLGHGESYKPSDLAEYNMERVFEHMAAWIDSLGLDEAPVLIGHSLGGYLALAYALRFEERVRALILTNPFYRLEQLSPTMQVISRRQLLNTTLIERTPYWMFRALVDLSSLNLNLGNGGGGHLLSETVRVQTALDYKRAAPGIFNLPRTLRDLTPNLPRLTKQTLVVWGLHDRTLYPPSFPKLVDMLPNARGETIEACGHVPHQCHVAQFNRLVLDFLASVV